MRRYIVVNAKGGCGKTTVATNLAACCALRGWRTTLFDYDPQYSSLAWLKARGAERAPIHGVAAHEPSRSPLSGAWQLRVPRDTQRIIVDTQAGVRPADLVGRIQPNDTLLVPIQPSAIDIRATADFIRDLILVTKIRYQQRQVAIVANRTRNSRRSLETLERFLNSLNIPVIAHLHDMPYYSAAAEDGIGICELEDGRARHEAQIWKALVDWLEVGAAEPLPTPLEPLRPSGANIRPVVTPSRRAVSAAQKPDAVAEVPRSPPQASLFSKVPAFLLGKSPDDTTRH